MNTPALWPATRLVDALARRELSSRELLDLFASRIERFNQEVNAVVTLDLERARARAAQADQALAAGETTGALHGLPITVKDALATAGLRSTAAAPELADHVPSHDAPVVARVREAGAIVFGKTNLPTWSADNQTFNDLFGVTRNPWDLARSPGGSSGGPAVATACGFTSFEIGTDIGGSIRLPSHYTGVCGHKPSFGLVPGLGYLDHPQGGLTEPDINVIGPITRTIDDLELVLGVVAGATLGGTMHGPWVGERGLGGLNPARAERLGAFRVGAWLDDPANPVDIEVRSVLDDAVSALEAAGAKIDRAARPVPFAESAHLFMQLLLAAMSLTVPEELRELGASVAAVAGSVDEDVLTAALRGMALGHREWLVLDAMRARLRARWDAWFEDFDVLLCPVTVTAAMPIDTRPPAERTVVVNGVERPNLHNVLWPGVIGVAYLPSTVVPIGRTATGLPVGIQVVGPYLGDRTTLAFARHIESVRGGFTPPPGYDD